MAYSREEIVDKTRELARMIAETEEVKFFQQAEAQMNDNEKINQLLSMMKDLQKQAVNFEHYGKKEALEKTEKTLAKIQAELDEMPIVQDFKQSQEEVNDLMQMVTTVISNTVTDEIIIATGGNLLSGETGSQVRNSHCKHA